MCKIKTCPKSGKRCSGNCNGHEAGMICNGPEIIPRQFVSSIHLRLQGAQWFKVTNVDEIFEIFDKVGDVSYRIVAGNTGQGKEHLIRPCLFISLFTFYIYIFIFSFFFFLPITALIENTKDNMKCTVY